MSEFDDPDLGRRLRAAAGDEPDIAVAYGSVRRRVGRARRRRAAALSGVAVVLLMGLGTVAAWGRDPSPDQIGTTSPDTGVVTTDSATSGPNTVLDPSSTVAGTPATAHTAATVITDPSSSSSSSTPPTSPPETSPSTMSTVPNTASSTPTTAAPAPVTQSFACTGGSISVRLQAGQLQLMSTSPAAGFTVDDQDVNATEVEVRFRSATHRSKVSVHLVGGAMQQQSCEEEDESESDDGSDGASASSSSVLDDD